MTMADNYTLIDYYPEVTRFNTVICKDCGTLVAGNFIASHDLNVHGRVAAPEESVNPFMGTAPAASAVEQIETAPGPILDDSLAPKPGGRVRNLHE